MITPVKYPLAKLLKEKGFDLPINKMYLFKVDYSVFNKTGSSEIINFCNGDKWECANEPYNWNEKKSLNGTEYFSAPTIAQVVMWLYEKHGIWIGVQPTSIVSKFQFRTYYNNKGVMNQHWNDSMSKQFKSPTEAYFAAIEYVLLNLI